MTDSYIISNPSSGREEAEKYTRMLSQQLQKDGHQLKTSETKEAGDAYRFAQKASHKFAEFIFVLGGDGTVNEVVDALAPLDFRPPIGIIPLGTVNNLSRMLNITQDPGEAIQSLRNYRIKRGDIAKVNDRYLISTLSAGRLPESVQEVDQADKEKLGPLAYIESGLKTLRDQEAFTLKLTIDGKDYSQEVALLVIGIGNMIFGVPNFFQDATIDDGLLHLLVVNELSLGNALELIPKVLAENTPQSSSNYKYYTGKNIWLNTPNENHSVTMDGEVGPEFPIEIALLHQHISYLVPH